MDLQSLVRGIEAYTQQHVSRYIDELCDLCSIDSYSYHKPGLDEMALWLAMRMRNMGIDATVIEHEQWGNDFVSVVHGEGKGNVLLVGHTDTVYPVGIATERPVWQEEDMLYGPGVSDMKGCILSAIYAIEAMLAAGHRPFNMSHPELCG